MTDLPRRRPRSQIVEYARADLGKALLKFEEKHQLDTPAALTLLAEEIGYWSRLVRGDARLDERFTHAGLTGVHETVSIEHRALVRRCQSGALTRDAEQPHTDAACDLWPLTDREVLSVLVTVAQSMTNGMLRVEWRQG